MATIDSLDLASLVNNPQSIGEALEDALTTTDSNIGALKTSAQTKKDDIDDLYDSALITKNNIDALYTSSTSTDNYHTTSFDDSWVYWNIASNVTGEGGLRIQRYGKLYVIHLAISKPNMAIAQASSTIKTVSNSDVTLPSELVMMGPSNSFFASSEIDKVTSLQFDTNGDINIYTFNQSGSTMHVIGQFIGIDQG
jgi:hypothetical protein